MNVRDLKWLIIAKFRMDGKLEEVEGSHTIPVCIDGRYENQEVLVTEADISNFLSAPTKVPA